MSSYYYMTVVGQNKKDSSWKKLSDKSFYIGSGSFFWNYCLRNQNISCGASVPKELFQFTTEKDGIKTTYEYISPTVVYSSSFDELVEDNYNFYVEARLKREDFKRLKNSIDYLKLSLNEKENVNSEFTEYDDIESYKDNIYEMNKVSGFLNIISESEDDYNVYGIIYESGYYTEVKNG